MGAPCYQCPDRHELCHMTCEKYLAYRAERDEQCRQRLTDRILNGVRNQRKQRAFDKYQKRRMTR